VSIQVEPDPAHPAGHALIRVPNAAAAVGAPGFRLQRDAGWGDDKLGPGGWQSSDALLVPDRAEPDGPDLLLHVGWGVCRHLEAGVYEISVPAAGVTQVGLYWPDIVPLRASAGETVVARSAAAAPAAQPLAPKAGPAPPVPPMPASLKSAADGTAVAPLPRPTSSAPGIARAAIPVAALLLLAGAGAGAYYWLGRTPEQTDAAQAPSAPAAAPASSAVPAPGAAPAALGGLSVPDVLAQAPNPAAITAEGQSRLSGNRHDDGLLLLEAAADRADPAAAAALARLYDPVQFQPGGPIPQPDPRQAARYYRDAARGGADVAAAREALRQNLQTRVQAGDLGANLSLKDFWP